MDETIGVKGGANDRRRTMKINKAQKKKLKDYEEQREIAELEKKVRKNQIFTLIKTLPLLIGGATIQTIHDTATSKKKDAEEDENSRWRIKEYDQDITHMTPGEFADKEQRKKKIIVTPTGEKIVVYITVPIVDKKSNLIVTEEDVYDPKKNIVSDEISEKDSNDREIEVKTKVDSISKKNDKTTVPAATKKGISVPEEAIDLETFIDKELSMVDLPNLSEEAKAKLEKLKSRKIVEEYEKQLKDIRYELRQVIYEYNVLVDENEKVVFSKEAEIILDKLSDVIIKIEELKRKIKIDDLDKYDDNYIYHLIEGYLKDFHDKKVISEIKDSPLYVMLEEKLEELDKKRGSFEKSVEEKKDKLEKKEEDFDKLKNRYYTIEQLNNQLLEFQYDQHNLLKDIQEKVRNAKTESERIETEFVGLNRQSRRLLNLLTFQMFLPGPKFAQGLAASAAAYLYFMNNVIRPNTRTRRYKVIMVQDYHSDIVDSINAIDDSLRLLGKTSSQIDKMIIEIEDRYKDYIGVFPECDELIRNLRKIKSDIEEKEYEMKRIKGEQAKELEKNDEKVKEIGEYPVN